MRRRRVNIGVVLGSIALLSSAAVSFVGCGPVDPIQDVDLLFRVDVGAETVELGKAFPLTVTRIWRRDFDVRPWDDHLLAPLHLEATAVTTRDDGTRVEDVRHFRAYAFTMKDVRIPAPRFTAKPKAGGPPQVARADTVRLRVRRVLDPADPGQPELPGPLPVAPGPVWPYVLVGLVLGFAVTGAVVWRRRRTPRRPIEPVVDEPSPVAADVRALALLAAIGERAEDDLERDVIHVSKVVRSYAGERYGFRAREMTTEELVAGVGSAGPALGAVLRRCDGVKFAGHRISVRERAALLDAAALFVRETAT